MGMFDSIIIDTDKLPVSDEEKKIIGNDRDWQTKDFECILTEIHITNNDMLMINRWEYETVPLEERPNPEQPFMGSQRRVNERLEILDHTRFVNFYCDVNNDWYEFYAKFIDGKLMSIDGGKNNYLD